jgi:hypothetical protein
MKFWVDAQLPPALAGWLSTRFNVDARSLRDIGLRDAQDIEISSRLSGKALPWSARTATSSSLSPVTGPRLNYFG